MILVISSKLQNVGHMDDQTTSVGGDEILAESGEIVNYGNRKNPPHFLQESGEIGGNYRASSKLQDNMMNMGSDNKLSLKLPTNFYSNLRRDYRSEFLV